MNTVQINLRTLAAVSMVCSTEQTRFYLCGVFVQCARDHVLYTACDGHRLITVREEIADPETVTNPMIGDFIIPTEVCRVFKPKKSRQSAFDMGLLSRDADDSAELKLQACGGNATVFKPIDGTFPDWRRVVPMELTGKTDFTVKARDGVGDEHGITYNPGYVADFAKFGETMDAGKGQIAYNSDGPAAVIFADDRILAVLMPMRGATQAELANSFARRCETVLGRPTAQPEEMKQAA